MTIIFDQGKYEQQQKAGVAILKCNKREFKAKISHEYARMLYTGQRKNRKRKNNIINICAPIIQTQTYKSKCSRKKQVN